MDAFGRSGTVAAAIEAAYFGVPAIALSSKDSAPGRSTYRQISEFAERLLKFTLSNGVFDRVDYLNVASPPGADLPVAVTQPASDYRFTAGIDESRGVFRFTHSEHSERAPALSSVEEPKTDREALRQGQVSVTPLDFPFTPTDSSELRTFNDTTH